jgi:predicted nucleic acid-binding protein
MMRVLLDTNVILDALLGRVPWDAEAVAIFEANRVDAIAAHVTASSLTDVFYVARKLADRQRAWDAVAVCLDQLAILAVTLSELQLAMSGPGTDLEDNLQIACASIAGLDAIVTRDPNGFATSPVPVFSPAELLTRITKDDDAR